MQIDWFTLVAQVINFLILLWLLQRFLYGPILRTMQAREEKLAAQFAEAEEKSREASAERSSLRAERQELADRREELLQEARAEAAERRRHMIHSAREETEALMARWYDAIEREKQSFLREVQTRIGKQTLELVRRALADLAGAELEQAIVGTFIDRLPRGADADADAQGSEERTSPADEARTGDPGANEDEIQPVVVRTSFDLPEKLKEEVRTALAPLVAQSNGDRTGSRASEIRFAQDPELICGIEARIHSRRIAWSIRDYLAELENNLDEAILQNGLGQSQRRREQFVENEVDEILPG